MVLVRVVGPDTSTTPKFALTWPGSSWTIASTWLSSAAFASTRPAPTRFGAWIGPCCPSWLNTSAPTVVITAALTSSTVQSGCAWRTRAPIPATCGDAIDVPLI